METRSNGEAQKTRLVTIVTVATSIYSISVGVWILAKNNASVDATTLQDYKSELDCYKCLRTDGSPDSDICQQKLKANCDEAWSTARKVPMAKCDVKDFLLRTLEEVSSYQWNNFFNSYLNSSEIRRVSTLEKTIFSNYQSIVHLSPKGGVRTDKGTSEQRKWTTVEYNDRENLFLNESGLYLLYARLTFKCKSKGRHRVEMEVQVHEEEEESSLHRTILHDIQIGECYEENADMLTIDQNSVFRLVKNSKLIVRYQAPNVVTLSSGKGKSSVGTVRLGNS